MDSWGNLNIIYGTNQEKTYDVKVMYLKKYFPVKNVSTATLVLHLLDLCSNSDYVT